MRRVMVCLELCNDKKRGGKMFVLGCLIWGFIFGVALVGVVAWQQYHEKKHPAEPETELDKPGWAFIYEDKPNK